jgi:hypothetical protein
VRVNRADPFNSPGGLGNGQVHVHPDGLLDTLYNLWNPNPVRVSRVNPTSNGQDQVPSVPNLVSY